MVRESLSSLGRPKVGEGDWTEEGVWGMEGLLLKKSCRLPYESMISRGEGGANMPSGFAVADMMELCNGLPTDAPGLEEGSRQ